MMRIRTSLVGIMVAGIAIAAVFLAPALRVYAGEEAGEAITPKVVELNSGAQRGPGFIGVNQNFTAADGKEYGLYLYGLKAQNKSLLLQTLEKNYDPASSRPLAIYDEAFVDAEKYDVDEIRGEENDNDSAQCWAASISDMLMAAGWADHFRNPQTQGFFSSEDEIFRYYNSKFSNSGCSNVANGIDWFFMGEFHNPTYSGAAAVLFDPADPEDGVLKPFVSSLVQQRYDLIQNPEKIETLKKCGWGAEGSAVFQASIGTLMDGEISHSGHSVAVAGIIVDPYAKEMEDQYRSIAIIDSDNDADPGLDPDDSEDPTPAQRNERKEARPNSVTIYDLKLIRDVKGRAAWQIEGYGADGEDPATWILYSLNELPLYSEACIASATETEGTKSAADSVDLTLESLFTTDQMKPIEDLYMNDPEKLTVTAFAYGEPVNLNFFIADRSAVTLDEAYAGDGVLWADWTVVRDEDEVIVAEGRTACGLPIYSSVPEKGFMAYLNRAGNSYQAWEPGAYTVRLALNAERTIPEAYYRNNVPGEFHFQITKAANPLKLKVTKKKYRKKKLTKAARFSIGAAKGKGKVTYRCSPAAKKAKIKVTASGRVTVPAHCKRGTYQIIVKAGGNSHYKAVTKRVRITVK